MTHALANLAANAVRYSDGARVTFEGEPEAVAMRVEDEHSGITEAKLVSVFEQLHRLNASHNRRTGGTELAAV